jgi:hypothetical protein
VIRSHLQGTPYYLRLNRCYLRYINSFLLFSQSIDNKAKGLSALLRGEILNDILALSCADSPEQSAILRTLFFAKWANHATVAVNNLINHFRREWCNERLGNWTHGHISNYVNCTNGLESTNNVIKNEVTMRQLMPIMNFLIKIQTWVGEQSTRRDVTDVNYIEFALQHSFTTLDWKKAHAWRSDLKKQIRYIPDRQTYVTLSAESIGVLTHNRAVALINTFNESSWDSYDVFTSNYANVTILTRDNSRPEGYVCSCMANRKEFTCCHSLAIAMIRGTMVAPEQARVHLLGRKKRRGRIPLAGPAWERVRLDINSPPNHPQQDAAELAGIGEGGGNLIAQLQEEI